MERLGNHKVLPIRNRENLEKLFSAKRAFWKEFRRDEISAINFWLVDKKEVIVVTLNLPEG
ncbi:19534_t:CDS:1, partial [Racocetra persica]